MAEVRTLKPFYDLVARVDRKEGEVFSVTDERAAYIEQHLPNGYVEVLPSPVEEVAAEEAAPVEETIDLDSMTVAQLRELAAERGVKVPQRVTKARLLALLRE